MKNTENNPSNQAKRPLLDTRSVGLLLSIFLTIHIVALTFHVYPVLPLFYGILCAVFSIEFLILKR